MIRIKIVKSSDFETLLQINNKERISEEDIPNDSWVKMILEVYAIWINKNGFGIFLRPILVSFKPLIKFNIIIDLLKRVIMKIKNLGL